MAAPWSLRDGTLTVRDGSTPANELEVQFVQAGFAASGKRNLTKVRNRHIGQGFIEGLDADIEGSLEVLFVYTLAQGSEPLSLREAVNRSGGAAAWVSTAPAGYAYALDWEFRGAVPGGGRDEIHTLSGVVVDNEFDWTESDTINTEAFPIMAISHAVTVSS